MQKEFGGYMPLELHAGQEVYTENSEQHVLRLNCGRNAIVVAAKNAQIQKLYIPYYNCDVVSGALKQYGVAYEYYRLNDRLEPDLEQIDECDGLLYVNYFGSVSADRLQNISRKFRKVIFDNTQALFQAPILKDGVYNAYSPRKFVGVCDGAYLVWKGDPIRADYRRDVSWDRAGFLFESVELGTNRAYADNLASKAHLGDEILLMSELTRRMLGAIDYDAVKQARKRNYRVLHSVLAPLNELWIDPSGVCMVYPFFKKKEGLRKALIANRVYVSQWWKYLIDMVPEDSIERELSEWLLPLPIDQRYSEEDMEQLGRLVLKLCNS